jgi:PAS domain S-box-containing protein
VTLQDGKGVAALRVRPEEMPGRPIFEVFPPVPAVAEALRSALNGKAFRGTCEFQRLVFELWCEPVRDATGEVNGLVGGAIDVASECQAALHRTSETLDAIIQASPIAIVTLDLEGRVTTWNPAAERMHGWSEEEVLGQPLPVLPEEMQQDIVEVQNRVLAQGGVTNLEHPSFRKDGSSVDASLSAAPLHNHRGEVTGAVYLVADVTEQKRTQRALERAKEEAEAASRAKSEFLANMSHEIRTPMNGVLGMTELALGTELTGEQREYLNCAKTSGESLLRLLNDILDFSKIEAGKLVLSAEDFDLRAGLADVMRAMAVRAQQKGLELTYAVDGGVPKILSGDFQRLRQMLVNLIDNSIKFTPAGEVSVRVRAAAQQGGEVCLEFSVADTGIGIPHDKQAEIFEAFTQADGSITRRFGGTGLGLSISSQLARLMGGSIGLESAPGAGSTFHLSLPFGVPGRAPAERVEPESKATTTAAAAGSRQGRVLLVEDNAVNRGLVVRLLEKRGFTVATASDGVEALEFYRKQVFDLILMDVQMPRMDGLEASARIRQCESEDGGHVPIVALTAHAMNGDRERCLEAGMDEYVSKPIHFQELFDKIDQVQLRARSS